MAGTDLNKNITCIRIVIQSTHQSVLPCEFTRRTEPTDSQLQFLSMNFNDLCDPKSLRFVHLLDRNKVTNTNIGTMFK